MTYAYTRPLARLIEEFQKLPGVGPKSAQRLAFHVLKRTPGEVKNLAEALLQAMESIHECPVCHNLSCQSPCELCSNPNRNDRVIAVVADPQDMVALERTGEFKGRYHILHGLISPMDGVNPEDLRIRELIQRLAHHTASQLATPDGQAHTEDVEEVILALPPSIEGDTTTLYLSRLLKPAGIKLTRIAFGLPVGGDLEYADSLTIARALEGRREV